MQIDKVLKEGSYRKNFSIGLSYKGRVKVLGNLYNELSKETKWWKLETEIEIKKEKFKDRVVSVEL